MVTMVGTSHFLCSYSRGPNFEGIPFMGKDMRQMLRRIPLQLSTLLLLVCLYHPGYTQENSRLLDSLHKERFRFEKLPKTAKNQRDYIDHLLKISIEHTFLNKDSFAYYGHKIKDLSKKAQYGKGLAIAVSDIGFYHSANGENHKAILYFKRAVAIADSIHQESLKPSFYNFLGLEYHNLWDYEKAFFYYLKGLTYAEKTKDHLEISEINENIALMYVDQEQYENAYGFYEKILAYNKKLGDEVANAETAVNLALIEAELGEAEKAMQRINQSIAFFEANKSTQWASYAYEIKGVVYLKQKNYKWALHWFKQSLTHLEDVNDDRYFNNLYHNFAAAYLGLRDYKNAMAYALKGLDACQKHQNTYIEKDLLEILYKIHKQQQNPSKALAYHERFAKIADSIHKSQNKTTLALFKTKTAFEKDKELLISKNKEELTKHRNVVWTTIAILVVLLFTSIPLYLNHKKLSKLLTKIKENTLVLKEREIQLSTTNKTKDRLFSIIGHDLRGPIAALQELLRLMEAGDLDKDNFYPLLPKVKKDVDHILFTLNNLLSWGNAQSKGLRHTPKTALLHQIAQQNVDLLSEMANHKQISLNNNIDKDIHILADVNQIDVVLRNLINNAIKFTPNHGTITLKASSFGDYWKVVVQDNGIGMDQQIQEKLFLDHATITNYGTNQEKGTGLGLSLCKEMLAQNKGDIWVESSPQQGSSFYFTLPKADKNLQKAG